METARFRHREDGGARNKGRETTGKRMERLTDSWSFGLRPVERGFFCWVSCPKGR